MAGINRLGFDGRKHGEEMFAEVKGFKVKVTVKDGTPHLSISLRDGRLVVSTSALSIAGMEHIAEAFKCAAEMTYEELDYYWMREHELIRQERARKKQTSEGALARMRILQGAGGS